MPKRKKVQRGNADDEHKREGMGGRRQLATIYTFALLRRPSTGRLGRRPPSGVSNGLSTLRARWRGTRTNVTPTASGDQDSIRCSITPLSSLLRCDPFRAVAVEESKKEPHSSHRRCGVDGARQSERPSRAAEQGLLISRQGLQSHPLVSMVSEKHQQATVGPEPNAAAQSFPC